MSDEANVLVGVGTLEVKTPDTMRAEWSDVSSVEGDHSVKLSKAATGDYGSTHVEIEASGNAAVQTLQDFENQTLRWGWDYRRSITVGVAWWIGMECRFEDPDSDSWVDVTTTAIVIAGDDIWATRDLADTETCYYGGWSELDGSFSDYAPAVISNIVTAVSGSAPNQDAVTAVDDWLLTRVRLELWETATERHVYVDNIYVDGVLYNLEPGDADTAGIRLSSMFTEVGYTDDGVTMEYTADTSDIEVEEETFPIDRVITKETVAITCNMAEASLFNMDKAMAGSLLSGSILKLGAGTNKKLTIQLHGINPAGETRAVLIPSCTATGAVGMPYKKGEKTVVPVTFQALKTTGHPAVTIVDNAA